MVDRELNEHLTAIRRRLADIYLVVGYIAFLLFLMLLVGAFS